MLIVEGPDGVGKTTLCQELVNSGLVHQILQSPARSHVTDLWWASVRLMQEYGDNPRIAIDRLLFSEIVYGPTLRGTCKFKLQEVRDIFRAIMTDKMVQLVIFCLPGTQVFHEDDPRDPRLYPIYDYWCNLLTALGAPVFRYDWTNFKQLAARIRLVQGLPDYAAEPTAENSER
jgi:hypothetical protein